MSDYNIFFNSTALKDKYNLNSKVNYITSSKKGKNVSYSAAKDLAKIAATENHYQLTIIKSLIRLQMKEIKNSGADPNQIAQVLGKMREVIKKADRKTEKLKKEASLESLKKEAECKNAKKEIQEVKRELEKRKRERKAKECSDVAKAYEMDRIDSQGGSYYPQECVGGYYAETTGAETQGTSDAGGSIDILF